MHVCTRTASTFRSTTCSPPVAERTQSPCAAAAHPAQEAQAACEAALQQARQSGIVVEEHDAQKPKLIEHVTSYNNIDWDYPLHAQLKPKLRGKPDDRLTADQLSRLQRLAQRWKEPSTLWRAHLVIRVMSETDFKEKNGQFPAEVGFSNFPPMWSYPPSTVNSSTENITFGMDVRHVCKNQTDKDNTHAHCVLVITQLFFAQSRDAAMEWRHRIGLSEKRSKRKIRTASQTTHGIHKEFLSHHLLLNLKLNIWYYWPTC